MRFFWKYFSQSGISEGQDEALRSRIMLINQFLSITIVLTFCGILNLVYLKDYHSIPVLACGLILLFAGTLINHMGHYDCAASCLLFVVNIEIFYYSSYFGSGSGIYFFYFPASMCIAFLFDFVKQKFYFLLHFTFLCCLILILLFSHLELFKGPEFSQSYMRHVLAFDLVVCVSLILYFIYLVTKTSEQRHRELVRYISERGEAEASVKASLKEKETLLAEVHHRVKNNLAVISGLLNLQMHSANNDYTRNVLLDCKSRVSSMALVHEKLYRSHSLAEINLHSYLPDLIREIRHAFENDPEQIQVTLSIPDVFLTVSEAIPCGLILNELITNSFKHAFPGKRKGQIIISIEPAGEQIKISVVDNGIGLPEKMKPEKAETLGLILIQSLAEQVGGQYQFQNSNGTSFTLLFTPSSSLHQKKTPHDNLSKPSVHNS
jgi:two-component sensor histidine kinase